MKTMTALAKEFLEKSGCEQPFNEIWAYVKKEYAEQFLRERGADISEQLETEDAIGDFYTDLTSCQDIIVKEGNIWNLAKRVKFDDRPKSNDVDDGSNLITNENGEGYEESQSDEEEEENVDEDEQSNGSGEQFNEEELYN